jgi:hypothetical protein
LKNDLEFYYWVTDRKAKNEAGCQWLTPVILAAWEAKIERIMV